MESIQSWVTHQWAGYFLKITGGAGSTNPWVRIVSNTDTALTISADRLTDGVPWPAGNPDLGSTYRLQKSGTDPTDACADDTTPDNERGPDFGEPLSPWLFDINDDQIASISDVLLYIGVWQAEVGDLDFDPRFDTTADGIISISDVLLYIGVWQQSCV